MTRHAHTLSDTLGYRFKDPMLLERALTHRSATAEHNERLEFLGDATLSMLVATELYVRFPAATEGQLSRMRANLVSDVSLAGLAAELDLGSYLKLGAGERKSGGVDRESIVAGALEALLGAVYLDGGIEPASALVGRIMGKRIAAVSPKVARKDAKTRLQEHLQATRQRLPEYAVVAAEGHAHAQTFTVECRVEGLTSPAVGQGTSRRKAEQAAAKRALEQLGLA